MIKNVVPLLGTLAITTVLLGHYGVGAGETALFTAYTIVAGTLPGTLIWRALRGRADFLAFDAAFGTAIGFVVELPVYLLCRELGRPLAVLAWPLATLLIFLVVPRLRRFWRGSSERLPAGVSWGLAAAFVFVLCVGATLHFRFSPMTEPGQAGMSMDYPFQFALVGLFKHDLPLTTPWVSGQALQYHWYVYAHGAAASRLTGIEPQTLILRLLPLPMIAAFLVVTVALVRLLTGRRWWPGLVAVLLTLVGVAVSPFAWTDRPTPTGLITDNLWISPTQTFAALFFIAAVFVLAGVQRSGDARRPLPWVTFALLMGAVAGAKATFVPMALCGLLLAAVLRGLTTRRAGPEVPAFAITLFWFVFAQLVLYGSGSQGTEVRPLQTIKFMRLGRAVLGRPGPVDDLAPLVALTLAGILATAFGWAGMIGLLRRGVRLDPTVHVMLGFAAAGVGGLWIFAHPGLSQTYFGRSASPYLAMLSAIGLAALLPSVPRGLVRIVGPAVLAAAAGLLAVQFTVGRRAPSRRLGVWSLGHALLPYVLVVALVAVLAGAVVVLARRQRLGRAPTAAAVAVLVLSVAVTSGVVGARSIVKGFAAGTVRSVPTMPDGAMRAGRWLRQHSAPTDIVATNSHCRTNVTGCDSRDFWLAAYAERRVVLQGWSYTERAFATGGLYDGTLARSRFWDPALLAANDAVFTAPTAASVASFTRAHGVRWLVAVGPAPALARYATERFTAGRVTVFEVRPASAPA